MSLIRYAPNTSINDKCIYALIISIRSNTEALQQLRQNVPLPVEGHIHGTRNASVDVYVVSYFRQIILLCNKELKFSHT